MLSEIREIQTSSRPETPWLITRQSFGLMEGGELDLDTIDS